MSKALRVGWALQAVDTFCQRGGPGWFHCRRRALQGEFCNLSCACFDIRSTEVYAETGTCIRQRGHDLDLRIRTFTKSPDISGIQAKYALRLSEVSTQVRTFENPMSNIYF